MLPSSLFMLCSLLFSSRTDAAPAGHTSPRLPAKQTDVSACKLRADNSVDLSVGFGYQLDCAPSTGALRAFMFFVDFPDAPADTTTETPSSLRDVFLPAAAEWYTNASFGRLRLEVDADTSRFHRMPARADSYGWARGLTAAVHERYLQDALQALGSVNFTRGGAVKGAVDVLYVVPTRRAAAISFTTTYMNDVRTRRTTTTSNGEGKEPLYVARKAVTFGHDVYATWGYKTLNHETGHAMCLPDMYPLPSGPTGRYVGGWDLMGLISGPAPDYFAWDKWRLGWLDDAQVDCVIAGSGAAAASTTHVLSPIETSGSSSSSTSSSRGTKAVVVRHNITTALVAEVRARRGVDAAACATGVLLYTVSTETQTGGGPIRVLDANPASGGCAGDELNDAPLSLGPNGTSSYALPAWGVRVTVTEQRGDVYTVKVDVS